MIQNRLFGLCFHSVESGKIVWQGQVIGNPEPGWYLVETYSWVDGTGSTQRLVRIEDMREWLFYPDHDAMNISAEYGDARIGGPYRKKLEDL